jgi:hypothetical protein
MKGNYLLSSVILTCAGIVWSFHTVNGGTKADLSHERYVWVKLCSDCADRIDDKQNGFGQ